MSKSGIIRHVSYQTFLCCNLDFSETTYRQKILDSLIPKKEIQDKLLFVWALGNHQSNTPQAQYHPEANYSLRPTQTRIQPPLSPGSSVWKPPVWGAQLQKPIHRTGHTTHNATYQALPTQQQHQTTPANLHALAMVNSRLLLLPSPRTAENIPPYY